MPSSSSNQRFQLPVLGPLDSLTKGTNIPPPPESPKAENSPALTAKPTVNTQPTNSTSPASKSSNYTNENQSPNTKDEDAPGSPTSTKPSSIRKFLSRKSLNQSYVNGSNNSTDSLSSSRPESPATFSTKSVSKRKSGGNWLKRLVSGSGSSDRGINKRTSTVFESMAEQENEADPSPPAKRQNGGVMNGNGSGSGSGSESGMRQAPPAPPPKLPELNQFKAKVDESTGSLGADMFANFGK